MQKSVCRRAMA